MKEAAINSTEGEGGGGQGGGWRKIKHFITEVATHIKADAKDRVGDKEAARGSEVGGDVTFHHATVATLDVCEKLPLRVPFHARRPCRMTCDC